MNGDRRRGLADLACRLTRALLPQSMRPWVDAVRCEVAGIPDGGAALLFAISSLSGLMWHAITSRMSHPIKANVEHGNHSSFGSNLITDFRAAIRHPRLVGAACASGAVSLGIAYMATAGAPGRHLELNAGALILGLTIVGLLVHVRSNGQRRAGIAFLATAALLLGTALLGEGVDGVKRWISLGSLAIQPSLVLLPVTIVTFTRIRSGTATAGVIIAAAALAIQPDRAMAGALTASLAIIAIMRPDRNATAALVASGACLLLTIARPDTLPGSPYVDQVLFTSFGVHPLAGLAVLSGSALLLVPAIVGWSRDPANRATYAVFGAMWSAVLIWAALGNYPTPLVGYGGSAILGYTLSLLSFPKISARSSASIADRSGRRGAISIGHPKIAPA